MVAGLVATGSFQANALNVHASNSMTALLNQAQAEGQNITFLTGQTVNIFDALSSMTVGGISVFAHLNNGGCFKNLSLDYVGDGADYYNINGASVTGKVLSAGAEVKIKISGTAQCGQYDIFENPFAGEFKIVLEKGTPEAPNVSAQGNVIVGMNDTMEYRKEGDNVWTSVPAGASSVTVATGGRYEVRVKETSQSNVGKSKSVTVYIPVQAPAAAVVTGKTDTTVTVTPVSGVKFSVDGGNTWSDGPVISGLTPDTNYNVIAKAVGDPDSFTADSAFNTETNVRTKKSSQQAGQAKDITLLSASDTEIKVKAEALHEYSIDNGKTWSSTGVFTGLDENTAYTVLARIAETDSNMAGQISQLEITTMCNVRGQVKGKDIPATVKIIDPNTGEVVKTVKTDKSGRYNVNVPSGYYNVVIEGANGAQSAVGSVDVPSNGAVDFSLKDGVIVENIVKDSAGKPAPGTTVTLYDKDGNEVASTVADGSGAYYFGSVKDGEYIIAVNGVKDGMPVSTTGTVNIKNGKISESDVTVGQGYLLKGSVVGKDDKALVNVKVVLTSKARALPVEATTNKEGFYIIAEIQEGKYTAKVTDPVSTASINVDVTVTAKDNGIAEISVNPFKLGDEITLEDFIKDNLTTKDGVIKNAAKDNYQKILDAEKSWNALSDEQKQKINDLLVNKYGSKTYEELLKDAKVIEKQMNTSKNTATNSKTPKTGDAGSTAAAGMLVLSAAAILAIRKKR